MNILYNKINQNPKVTAYNKIEKQADTGLVEYIMFRIYYKKWVKQQDNLWHRIGSINQSLDSILEFIQYRIKSKMQ